MERTHPIESLDGLTLGDYTLNIVKLQQTKMSGWKFFAIGLSVSPQTQAGPHAKSISTYAKTEESVSALKLPVIEGIYSSGGKGVAPWMEIFTYNDRIELNDRAKTRLTVDLSHGGLDRILFKRLGKLIPSGGHVMLWYEGKRDEKTYQPLLKGVPPVVTKPGSLLFWAGCRLVKDFSLPEGGMEGSKKLWGEKPMNEQHKKALQRDMAVQIHNFLGKNVGLGDPQLENDLKKAALEILSELET